MPFAGGALLYAIHERNHLLQLAAGVPGTIVAVLMATDHGDLALLAAVAVPLGRGAVVVALHCALGAVVVEHTPRAVLLAALVVMALLVYLAVAMPPGPVSLTHAVVAHHALYGHLTRIGIVEFLITYLCMGCHCHRRSYRKCGDAQD